MPRATGVPISPEVMSDQKRVLVEEHDMTEEEADQVYTSMKTQVMLLAQNADRDWDKEEYEAVTDVLMGIQHQQAEVMEQVENSRMTTIARTLPKVLAFTGAIQLAIGTFFVMSGATILPTVAALSAAVVLLIAAGILS